MLGILTKLQKSLNTNTLRTLYFTFIHTYLTNGLIVWGSADKTHLEPLIKNQKKAIRTITFSSCNAHTTDLFKQMNILPLLGQSTNDFGWTKMLTRHSHLKWVH